jgi:thioredoxin 1
MDMKHGIAFATALTLSIGLGCSSAKDREPAGARGTEARTVTGRVPRLVDLGANRCVPCRAMAPILEDLKKDYTGRLEVQFIDVWQDRAAGERYRIGMIPTQIFFAADGTELARHEGFFSREEILTTWARLGVKLD